MTQKNVAEVRLPFSSIKEPHKGDVTKQLQDFISKVNTNNCCCLIQFIKGKLELSTPIFSKKVILHPSSFLEEKQISQRCSKFNIVSSIASTNSNCTYSLSIDDAEIDGEPVADTKVLRMLVKVDDLATAMVLRNLFSLFDES